MIFKITTKKNGILVTARGNDGLVFQEVEDDPVDAWISFLYALTDEYGPNDCKSRYSKKRIKICALPGDKYEGKIDYDLPECEKREDYEA